MRGLYMYRLCTMHLDASEPKAQTRSPRQALAMQHAEERRRAEEERMRRAKPKRRGFFGLWSTQEAVAAASPGKSLEGLSPSPQAKTLA